MAMEYGMARGAIAGVGMEARNAYAGEATPIRDNIGGVANDLQAELERLQGLHVMLERIADHVDGPVPQQSGTDKVSQLDAPSHSLLDSMRRKQRAAQVTITRCEQAAQRIAVSLGV
jgi:hypothetical protein